MDVSFAAGHACGIKRALVMIVEEKLIQIDPTMKEWQPVSHQGQPQVWEFKPGEGETIKSADATLSFARALFVGKGRAVQLQVWSPCPVPGKHKLDRKRMLLL